MHRLARLACGSALVVTACAVGLPFAAAAPAQDGLLRLAHLSPDAPTVDVYVDSVADPAADVTLRGVSYGDVSDYRSVPPGVYTVSMRPAGAPASAPAVLSTTVQVQPGSASTVAGVGHAADLGLRILQDDLTPPPAGEARVRVVDAAASATPIDVAVAGGPQVATGLAFAHTSDYVTVPGGQTTLLVSPPGASPTRLPVTLSPGAVYSVLVLDRPGGGLTVRPVLDAAGAGVVPAGSVPAGEGGTAGPARGTVTSAVAAGVAALAVVALLTTARVRLPRRGCAPRHGQRS